MSLNLVWVGDTFAHLLEGLTFSKLLKGGFNMYIVEYDVYDYEGYAGRESSHVVPSIKACRNIVKWLKKGCYDNFEIIDLNESL